MCHSVACDAVWTPKMNQQESKLWCMCPYLSTHIRKNTKEATSKSAAEVQLALQREPAPYLEEVGGRGVQAGVAGRHRHVDGRDETHAGGGADLCASGRMSAFFLRLRGQQ